MELERVQQNTPKTLEKPWTEGGVAVDPGTVTIGITRADGTELVAPLTGTGGSGTAARTFNLTTTHTALLDSLKVTWTSTLKGTLTDTVEVVGGFLFRIDEARAAGVADSITAAQISDMRTAVEQRLERALSAAYVPRFYVESFNPASGLTPVAEWPFIRAVRFITQDGVAVTPVSSAVNFTDHAFYFTSGFATAYSQIVVGYEHGADQPEEPLKREALRLTVAAFRAGASTVDPNIASYTTDDGSVRYRDAASAAISFPIDPAIIADYDMSLKV